MRMEFRDLKRQYAAWKQDIDEAVSSVLLSARFISGPQVRELEERLAEYTGVRHCVTCGNGTDAISLAMAVWGIGPGDAVFVPDFTFFSSGECPALAGASPVFVDVDPDTFNLDPERLEEAVLAVKARGELTPRAVVAVDLFGLPADFPRIRDVCRRHGLLLLEDGAQGFGGSLDGKRACSFGDISITSFFPAKPLGCYGDGGAVFTDSDEWAALLRSLCVHGKSGEDKYDNVRIGRNSRLDTLQAAVLLPKLRAFETFELEAVNRAAALYTEALAGCGLALPRVPDGAVSSWAQYTVRLPETVDRAALQARLREDGIPSMVYYARPMHRQGAFRGTVSTQADCPVTERLCRTVLSLPMHPYLTEEEIRAVADALRSNLQKEGA